MIDRPWIFMAFYFVCFMAVGLWTAAVIRHPDFGSNNGTWGHSCKDDLTCDAGLICVSDSKMRAALIRRSLCVNPHTMNMGWGE
jgi:hypothetical protein